MCHVLPVHFGPSCRMLGAVSFYVELLRFMSDFQAGYTSEDWKCACKDSSFQPSANTCFQQSCSNADMLIGESMVDTGCSNGGSISWLEHMLKSL